MRDIVGLYLDPPHHALLLCVDEKSQIQALSRTQPVLPMRAGQRERRTHDYKRHGVTSLFAALDIATGNVLGKCYRRHRSVEFLDFLKKIDTAVPADLDIHLVLDNYGTQDSAGPPVVTKKITVSPALHSDACLLAQPGGTLVRTAYPTADQARFTHQRAGTRNGDPRIHRCPQPTAQTLSMDQVRRPDPGLHRSIRYFYSRRALTHNLYEKSMTQETSFPAAAQWCVAAPWSSGPLH